MWRRIQSKSRFAFDLLRAAGREYGFDRVGRMSAAVAYRAIFAIAPLFLIAVSVFGAVVGSSVVARQRIFDAIEQYTGPEVASAFDTFLGSAVESGDAAAFVGAALLLWTVSSLFFEVQNDLNDIFHVPYENTTGIWAFVKKRGIGFLWGIGVGFALAAVWLVNVTWQLFQGLFPDDLVAVHRVIGWVTPLVSLLILPLLFGLLIQTLTMTKIRWRAVRFGGLAISVGFVLAALGTRIYFGWEEGTSALTVAGSFFVLLLVAFIMSSVFFYGAVVTKVYEDYLEEGDVRPPTVREEELGEEAGPVMAVAEPPPAMPVATVFGFIAGLFVGWRRGRR